MKKATNKPTKYEGEGTRGGVKEAKRRADEKAKESKSYDNRFYLTQGNEAEVIILDDNLEDTFWRNEHNLPDPNTGRKFGNYRACLSERGTCPYCTQGNRASLMVYLTILDCRPYKNNRTKEMVHYTKRLLTITRGQYEAFEKLETIAKKKHGTLRGVSVFLQRDNGDTSFRTGLPVANDDGNLINDFLTEADLKREFGHPAIKNREGKVVREANADLEIYDYEELMPSPTDEEVESAIQNLPGSRKRGSEDEVEEPRTSRTTRSSRTEPEPERSARSRSRAVEDEDEVEEDEPRTRGRSRGRVEEPPKASGRSRRQPTPEEDEDEETEVEDVTGTGDVTACPSDYEDWTSYGQYMDGLTPDDEDFAEGNDAFLEACEALGIDANTFQDWETLGQAMDQELEDLEPAPPKKTTKKKVASKASPATSNRRGARSSRNDPEDEDPEFN